MIVREGEQMIRRWIYGVLSSLSLIHAADTLEEILTEGKVYGNLKYYYIQTDKQNGTPKVDSSANANAIGGQLGFKTGVFHGFSAKATFMTTNGIFLDDPVDASIIGRDNGVLLEGNPNGPAAQRSFSVLGEALIRYEYKGWMADYGRQIINTPLIHAKVVRMLPSTVQGAMAGYHDTAGGFEIDASYLTHFKQRTSNRFHNILKHALGEKTREITGRESGEVIYLHAGWRNKDLKLSFYDYYTQDFLNSIYLNAEYKGSVDRYNYLIGLEGIMQRSIGNANTNLAKAGSVTGGKRINTEAFSIKGRLAYAQSHFLAAFSYVAGDSSVHDSLVLPWDGTPLYTNMITSNDLFNSNYGKGLGADSLYIGGTTAFKIAYTQTYDFTGYKGFKTVFSYMLADNDRFSKGKQQDFNIVLGYRYDKHFSIALKGIFVKNNTNANADGSVRQTDDFQQYRVIADYRF